MISGFRRARPWVFVGYIFFAVLVVRAQAPDVQPDSTRDTLVYKDGDRVHGHLIRQTGDTIVFKSDRFGELHVSASDVVVIKAEKPPEEAAKQAVAEAAKPAPTAAEKAEEEQVSIWDRFSPAVLTAKVRDFFGPWHGRVAFSNEIVTDTAHRDSIALETKLLRKFDRDAVEMTGRYDYDQTNGSATTDVFKGVGSWRHDFNRFQFSQYRPTVEWNRASIKNGVLNQYVLMQQEFGFGLNVISKPARKVRVGVSENLFDVWNSAPTSDHSSHAVASLFEEMELALPWRMSLTQRGVWYPESKLHEGFEDQVELNKKLTETLSVAIRHEIRRDNPDGASQDYTRLRLLLGLDF